MERQNQKVERAIILAAGMGVRLQPLTLNRPKCLLPFLGKTILEYQITQLKKCGITDIVVVIGYQARQVIQILPAGVRYILNPDYQTTNSLYSLYLARENLDRAVLLMNGDVICDTQLLSGLIKDPFPNVLLVEFDKSLQDGEMNVRTQDGLVVEIGKHVLAAAADGESAQIVKFGSQSAALLKNEVEQWIQDQQVHAFPSNLYHVVIHQAGLRAMKTDRMTWFEIDTLKDYQRLCSYYGYGKASARGIKYILTFIFAVYRRILYAVSDKRAILFNVVRENHFLMYEPLYERLSRDSRLSICFTSSWDSDSGCQNPARKLLDKYNIPPERIISARQAYWRRWDICVDVDYKIARTVWPTTRIQMFHGFNGKFRDKGLDGTIHQSISKFDALFCFSQAQESLFKASGYLKKNCRTFCIGLPKLDEILCTQPTRDAVLSEYGADPGKLALLYAPSWNPELSLNSIGEELIEALPKTGWTVMVKPHPMSLQTFGDISGYKRYNWHQYLSRLHREGVIVYITDQNACRYLKAADILISDHGSTTYEYMILNRPILYYDTVKAASIMTMPETLPKLRRVVVSFQSAPEVLDIIKNQKWKDFPAEPEIRRELIEFRFYDIGQAAIRAVDAIYLLLKIIPPAKAENTNG